MTTGLAPLPEDLGRFGYGAETSFKTLADFAGAKVDVGGLTALDPKPARTRIEKPILRNSEKDGFQDHIGAQSFDLTVEHTVSDLTKAQVGALIGTSLGETVAADALSGFVSGNNASVTKTADAHVYDEIIKVPADDGNTYHVPVKTKGDSPDTATFAFLLPGSAAANGAPKNASQTGGAAYRDKPDGTVSTYQLRVDQSNYTNQVWLKGSGAIHSAPFELVFTPNGLLRLRWQFRAATWVATQDTTSGLADTNDNTEEYISNVCSVAIQDLGTPVALNTTLTIKALKMMCGYSFEERTGSQAVSGTTVPSSFITGWNRRNSCYDDIEVTLNDSDWKQWDDIVKAKTSLFFWAEFQPGAMSGTAGSSRLCIFRPQVKVVQASPVKVDGQGCTALVLQTERRASASQKREYISLFGTS